MKIKDKEKEKAAAKAKIIPLMIMTSLINVACGPTQDDASSVEDVKVVDDSRADISLSLLQESFPAIYARLVNPKDAEADALTVRQIGLGAGSAPVEYVNQPIAEEYSATWGEASMDCNEGFCTPSKEFTMDGHTGWGMTAPGTLSVATNFRAYYMVMQEASMKAELPEVFSLSRNARSKIIETVYSLNSVEKIEATFNGKSAAAEGGAVVFTVLQRNKANGEEKRIQFFIRKTGEILGFLESSSEVWNGTVIPLEKGPSAAAVFL